MNVILVQLPIPRLDLGRRPGAVPLGAACLAQAAADLPGVAVTVVAESRAAFLGDAALLADILARRPDAVGFSIFCWNVKRSLYFAEQIKAACGARILFGGPEVTPDNPTVQSPVVDAYVCGEGEAVFRDLLTTGIPAAPSVLSAPAGRLFTGRPSPYLAGRLEPAIENLMMLETQRGCPYRCGYCYYNKSISGRSVADTGLVLDGVRWAVDQGLAELFFLDPSLNARPNLPAFLEAVAAINQRKSVGLLSEIRAEAITPELADRFAAAGFTWFEIGLQSTSARAQKLMNRPTRLDDFLRGVGLLKERGIAAGVDLIAGLPGDDLAGFKASVDFMAAHGLTDDVQVFPLSVLPGTDFRKRASALTLTFDAEPPYPVIRTAEFSEDDLLDALHYAESRLRTVLYPMPDLNLHYRSRKAGAFTPEGHYQPAAIAPAVSKIILRSPQPLSALEAVARRLTYPYQIFVWPKAADAAFINTALNCVTELNAFTPFEIIFMGIDPPGGAASLLPSIRLRRPHYLDLDQRYLCPEPGNRAVLFTIVTTDTALRTLGDMQRQVYWWQQTHLPSEQELSALDAFDGILMDGIWSEEVADAWQTRFAPDAPGMPAVAFADSDHHRRWIQRTASEAYYMSVL
ncbi:MAG: B12-binding domain-containing radical SAM protein [Pseudomonadota bacterium]